MNGSIVGQFPALRLRRLRQNPVLRRLVTETRLSPEQLVLPLFARPGRQVRQPVASMPGVFQLSPDEVVREAAEAHATGVPAVLLFGSAVHWLSSSMRTELLRWAGFMVVAIGLYNGYRHLVLTGLL